MQIADRLIKSTFVYSLGGVAPNILTYALLPLYTACLTTSEYGKFDVLMVTLSLLTPFISMDIPNAVYRFHIGGASKDLSKYFSTALVVLSRNLLIFNFFALALIAVFHFEYSALFIVLVNVSIASSFLSQTIRSSGKVLFFSIFQISNTAITLGVNIVLILYLGMKVEALLISHIIANVSTILALSYYLKVWSLFSLTEYSKSLKNNMLRYSLPLMFSTVAWWVMMSSDRYMISYFCGTEGNGIYSIANKIPSLLTVLYLSFGFSWQDSAITNFDKVGSNVLYTKIFNTLMTLVLSIGLVLIASSKFILTALVDEAFYMAWLYVPFLVVSSVFYIFSSFYSVGFHCIKKNMGSLYTACVGAVVNILANFLLIPLWGLQGAAVATCLSFFVMWITRVYCLKDVLCVKINMMKLLSLLCLVAGTIFLSYLFEAVYLNLLLLLGTIMIALAYNYSLVVKFLKLLLNRSRLLRQGIA